MISLRDSSTNGKRRNIISFLRNEWKSSDWNWRKARAGCWKAEDIWQNRSRNAENQQGWKPSTFWDLHFTVDRQGKEAHG